MHILAIIISICWILFWLYWIISAFGSKKGTAPNIKRFFGTRIIILLLAATLLSGRHIPLLFKNHFLGSNEAISIVGFILFLLGMTLAIWARIYLGRNWGMPMTQKEDPELVTTGPYRYIRHPIYTGILLMSLGSAIDVNTFWLVVFIAWCAYFVYSAFAEEKLMTQQFSKVYPAYKSRTKMLIPFIF
jgi:protein-S-isoprenylcysteine O-methyltransferase Ste14